MVDADSSRATPVSLPDAPEASQPAIGVPLLLIPPGLLSVTLKCVRLACYNSGVIGE